MSDDNDKPMRVSREASFHVLVEPRRGQGARQDLTSGIDMGIIQCDFRIDRGEYRVTIERLLPDTRKSAKPGEVRGLNDDKERAAIVSYLRRLAGDDQQVSAMSGAGMLKLLASRIERGEHIERNPEDG